MATNIKKSILSIPLLLLISLPICAQSFEDFPVSKALEIHYSATRQAESVSRATSRNGNPTPESDQAYEAAYTAAVIEALHTAAPILPPEARHDLARAILSAGDMARASMGSAAAYYILAGKDYEPLDPSNRRDAEEAFSLGFYQSLRRISRIRTVASQSAE